MAPVWPLVGRATELEVLADRLNLGEGALILSGAAGVGKTRLGAECLDRAQKSGFVPLRVAATLTTSVQPFGAFSFLLPDLPVDMHPANLLRYVAQVIARRGGGKPVAILVDDAHLLDESSAALTYQLAQTPRVFVVATVRSRAPAPDAVMAMWKDGLAERLEVDPLSPEQLLQLLEAALGGPVEGSTIQALQEKTQGNALFLRELVLGAQQMGALKKTDGLWRLVGDLPFSARLVEIVETRLGSLSEKEQQALGIVAVGEPVGVAIFEVAEPGFDLEALERKGLVRVQNDDRRLLLRLDHPLHGEVLRAKLSALATRRIAGRLAEAVERTGARRRSDPLQIGVWRLETGGPFRGDLMLQAAITARQRNDFPLAERLARAAVDTGGGFDAALLIGQLRWYQKRAVEAEEHLKSIAERATTDAQKAQLASARVEVLDLGLNDWEAALRVAEEAEDFVNGLDFRDQLAAERARVLGRRGRNAAAVAIVEPLLERAQGRTLIAACFAAATSMAVTGQFKQGMEATELGYLTHRRLSGPPVGYPPELHLALRCGLLLQAGYLTDASDLARTEYRNAVSEKSPLAIGFFSLFLSLTCIYQGRCTTAERYGREALASFGEVGFPFMQRNALATIAYARAMQGLGDDAKEALDEVEGLDIPSTDYYGPVLLQARAWKHIAERNARKAIDTLGEAIDVARWSGAAVLESAALHDFVRLGKAGEVVSRLDELAQVLKVPFAQARARHAIAVVDRDPAGLAKTSRAFEEMGSPFLAAEAAADEAVVWRRKGEDRKATAAQRRSESLGMRCEGVRSPALSTSTVALATLTPRELEIARLAANRLSNREIASRLVLSHRTVENQLHSAYAKLGVAGRMQLAEALRGSDARA